MVADVVLLALTLVVFCCWLMVSAFAAPPGAASYRVCIDTAGTTARTLPHSTDAIQVPYWWTSDGNMHVMNGNGVGYWYTAAKPSYSALHSPQTTEQLSAFVGWPAGFSSLTHLYCRNAPYTPPCANPVGAQTYFINTDSIVNKQGPGVPPTSSQIHNGSQSRHTWPSGNVVSPDGTKLYLWYFEEMPSCATNTAHPTATQCNTVAFGTCYWDYYMSKPAPWPNLAAPTGGNIGYNVYKTSNRPNLAVMSIPPTLDANGSPIVTDLGRLVHEGLMPMNCDDSSGSAFVGGITSPSAMVEGSYVYVTMRNNFPNLSNLSDPANQGTIIARIAMTDLLALTPGDAVANFWFWDTTDTSQTPRGSWTYSTMETNPTRVSQFATRVKSIPALAASKSWYTSGQVSGSNGFYIQFSPHWNTQLGTWVATVQAVASNDTNNFMQPRVWYFAGASLATDPLNWKAFDSWIDYTGAAQIPAANGGVSTITYHHTMGGSCPQPPGTNALTDTCQRDSLCDYYPQLVGPNANTGCLNGQESATCIGARADFFMENWSPAAPTVCTGQNGNWVMPVGLRGNDSHVYVVFAKEHETPTCAGVVYPVLTGFRGLR